MSEDVIDSANIRKIPRELFAKHILDQDVWWHPKDSEPVKLVNMTDSHKENLLSWLERNVINIYYQYTFFEAQIIGKWEHFFGIPDDFDIPSALDVEPQDIDLTTPKGKVEWENYCLEWLSKRKLYQKLLELTDQKVADRGIV